MKLLRYIVLCFFVTTLNASNVLDITEGNEFKSSAAPNIYLHCISVCLHPESKDLTHYKFSIYLSSKDVSNLSAGSLELAYDSSLHVIFLRSLNINSLQKRQEYETAAIIIAFKACISKLTKLPDNFWTLLPPSEKDTFITLCKMGFKVSQENVGGKSFLMLLSVEDFLKKYPEQ